MTSGVEVPESHTHTGERLINPPAADTVPIQVALGSPFKMRVSVSGKIIQVRDISDFMTQMQCHLLCILLLTRAIKCFMCVSNDYKQLICVKCV